MMSILKDTNNFIFEGIDTLNPMVSKMDEKNQEIATILLDAGYKQKEIQHFIDVSTTQFEEWIELEIKVRDRMAAAMTIIKETATPKA